MDRRVFSKIILSLSALPLLSFRKTSYRIRLLRHATLIVEKGGVKFLVDPMLSPKGTMDPVGNAGNDFRIPMIDLTITKEELSKILTDVDAVLVTHTHRDHWDAAAQQLIDKSKPILCQPSDLEKIKGQGFTNVRAIGDKIEFKGIVIHRTGGQHGTGDIGQRMGMVSGFMLEQGSDRLYIAGDTIWCADVEGALKKFGPQTTVVNSGGAQFLTGDAITMTADDVGKVASANPNMTVIAVHMNTVNHCKVTRDVLREYLLNQKLHKRVLIPADGEVI